jgi:hypothetical protein
MSEVTDFYRRPSRTSGLGRHAGLVAGFPDDAEALGAIVRGLLIHNYTATVQGLPLPAERMAHMRTVGAEAIIATVIGLDPSPLRRERPAGRRMVGFCYHFALLHCALLRAAGVPARTRCGFASYLDAGRWIDHWVTEYWDGSGWRLTDPQTGRHGLTRGDFQDGVTAWRQCRGGVFAPASYGNGELWGWDELRGTLINDVAALGKVEIGGWYWCDRLKVEPRDRPHDELDASLDLFCQRAAAAESAEALRQVLDSYPEFQPPADAVAR